MAASSSLPKRSGPSVPFLFLASAVGAALMPTSIGYQDLAALLARQPGVSQRWREHLIASPFGTIHAATFSFALPLGTAMPRPLGSQPVNFDPGALDVKTWSAGAPALLRRAIEIAYPTVNRRLKGDRLPVQQASPLEAQPASLPQLQPVSAPPAPQPPVPAPSGTPRPKSADGAADADASAATALPHDRSASLTAKHERGRRRDGRRAGTWDCERRRAARGAAVVIRRAIVPQRRSGRAQCATLFRRRRHGLGAAVCNNGRRARPRFWCRRRSIPTSSCRR